MKHLFYVTSNSGKFAEVEQFLKRHAPEIALTRVDMDIPEIQSMDQQAVAIDKAQKAWNKLKSPLLIDDAGIYFDRWNQFPGVLTKYVFQGLGMEGVKRLIDAGDTGYFALWLVYVDEQGVLHPFEGKCLGRLTNRFKGTAHEELPYDLCFIPDGLEQTYAEIKNNPAYESYFYRIRAVQAFLDWFKTV
jgi:XTP/dITP diphosphohydrolase